MMYLLKLQIYLFFVVYILTLNKVTLASDQCPKLFN